MACCSPLGPAAILTVSGSAKSLSSKRPFCAEVRNHEFVSFLEQLDTSNPAGKMVFTVLGAVAELERRLIVKRVKAGLRNARAKGKQLGRPKKILHTKTIATLRAKGVGWKRIAAQMGVGAGTIYRVALEGSKIREKVS
jgi:DNA invertase Pin-like site-specific DNA recombinase